MKQKRDKGGKKIPSTPGFGPQVAMLLFDPSILKA